MELAEHGIRVNSLTPTATDPAEGAERAAKWALSGQDLAWGNGDGGCFQMPVRRCQPNNGPARGTMARQRFSWHRTTLK